MHNAAASKLCAHNTVILITALSDYTAGAHRSAEFELQPPCAPDEAQLLNFCNELRGFIARA